MKIKLICFLAIILSFGVAGMANSGVDQNSGATQPNHHKAKRSKKPGKEMARGGKDVGVGAAKGSADLGKGVVGGVGNLATGHPAGAGVSVARGAGGFGKDVGVGTTKGVAKLGKGLGGEFKKLHKHSKKKTKANSH